MTEPEDYQHFGGAYADPITGKIIGPDPAPGSGPDQPAYGGQGSPYDAQGQPAYGAPAEPAYGGHGESAYGGHGGAYGGGGEPPYGGIPPYGGQGGAAYPAPGPYAARRRRMAPVLLAVAGAVVLVAAGITGGMLVRNSGGHARPATVAAPPPSTSTSSTAAEPSTTAAITKGWQSVLSTREGIAYDVPANWEVLSAGTLVGFEKPDKSGPFGYKPYVAAHNPAEFHGRCTGNGTYRAQTAVLNAGKIALPQAASGAAVLWTQGATMAENGTVHHLTPPPAKPLRLSGGSMAEITSLTDTTQDPGADCPAPKVTTTTVAMPVRGSTVVLIICADQGVADGVDAGTVSRIAQSLRAA